MQEKVSIIIPVYNAANYIEQTISSVLAQDYECWELLLVENGSTDNSIEKIKKFDDPRIRLIILDGNAGAANARNEGMRLATGIYVGYLDADDLWQSNKLSKQISFMKENGAAFCFTGYEFGDENAVGTGKVVYVPETLRYRQALSNTTIFTSTVLFDTRKISKDRLYMPNVKSEDSALWFRVLREGNTAYGLDENLVIYRRPGKSLSSNKIEAMKRIWNLYRKQEKLNVFYSVYLFVGWAFRAVKRRV
ncbi:MAG: glycosyltransferase family 2 protein [Lachnospiraceae bacterium]|nr:glycosyltransferase family 2 protein [Lachnospiraceae bacterium]